MFLMNDLGEIVNVNAITAISVCDDRAPYEIRVYTPATKFGVDFRYNDINQMRAALRNLNNLLSTIEKDWVKLLNWKLAANKIESIGLTGEGARIRMFDGQYFDIIAHTPKEREQIKSDVSDSFNRVCGYMKPFMYPDVHS